MCPGKTQFKVLNSHHQRRGPGAKRSSPGQDTPLGLVGCGSGLLQKKQRTERRPQKLTRRGPLEAYWKAWSSSLRLHKPRSWCQLAQPSRVRLQRPKPLPGVYRPLALTLACETPASGGEAPLPGKAPPSPGEATWHPTSGLSQEPRPQ